MNEQEIEALVNELTAAGATEQEIATILDEKIAQAKKTQLPPPTESITQPTGGTAQPTSSAGFQNFKTLAPKLRDDVSNLLGMFNRGASQVVSAPLKLLGAVQELTTDKLFDLAGVETSKPLLTSAGEAVTEFTENMNPVTPEFEASTTGQVSQGVGQAAGMMATMGLGGAAPLVAEGTDAVGFIPAALQTVKEIGKSAVSRPGFVGGAMTAAPEWEAAKAAGQSDEQAFNTLIQNYFVGQTEVLPIQNILGKLNRATGNTLINTLKNMASGGFQEGVQEGIQTYLTNQIAQGGYDPDRDPLFQVLESAKIGGIVGLILPGVGTVMQSTSPEVQQKLTEKIIDLSANGAIADASTGNKNIDLQIDQAGDVPPVVQQMVDQASEPSTQKLDINQPSVQNTEKTEQPDVAPQQNDINIPQLAKEFNETGVLLGQDPTAEAKPVIAEQVADFLRSKNVTNEAQVNEFIDEFNALPIEGKPVLKIADAKRAYELLVASKPKPFNGETVERTVNEEIKRLTQERAKGKTEGFRAGQEFKNNLVSRLQEAMKEANLRSQQINAVMGKIRKTNAFTAGSVSKLGSFVNKVITDAEYADKLDQAYELQSKVKKQVKSSPKQNLKQVSKEFGKLDPQQAFDNVDDYIKLAQKITSGGVFDEFEVMRAVNEQKAKQRKEEFRQELGDLTDEEIDELGEDGSDVASVLKGKEVKAKELRDNLTTKTEYSKLALESEPSLREYASDERENEILDLMLSADPSKMDINDMIDYNRTADNILINGDFSGADRTWAKLKAIEADEKLAELDKKASGGRSTLGVGSTGFFTLGQAYDKLFNKSRIASDVQLEIGLTDALNNGSVTHASVNTKLGDFGNFVNDINKKYPSQPDIRRQEQQWKVLVLGVLARNTDGVSHLPKIKANIEKTIELYKESDPELGKKLEQFYQPYKNVESSDDAIALFKKNDPKVYETWQWLQDNVLTDDLTNAANKNTTNLHNQAFIGEKNYFTYSQKKLKDFEGVPDPSEPETGEVTTLRPKQSVNTKAVTRSLARGYGYNLDVFGGIFRAYQSTLMDINTSRYQLLLHEVTKRPSFQKLVGSKDNRDTLVKTMARRLAEQSGRARNGDSEIIKATNDFVHAFRNIGVALGLGGFYQIATQSFPVFIATVPKLGTETSRMLTHIPSEFRENVIKKTTIAEAGERHGQTSISDTSKKYLSEESQKKWLDGFSQFRRFTEKGANFKLKPLTWTDVNMRHQSFTAFYIKRLKELGVKEKEIDLKTEHLKKNDPKRRTAMAFATSTVANLQVPTNKAEMGDFWRTHGGWEIVRNILMPFSVFPANTKNRLYRGLGKMKVNPSEGFNDVMSVAGESVAFSALKSYIIAGVYIPIIMSVMRSFTGVEEPEKDEEKDEENFYQGWLVDAATLKTSRKVVTGLINDASPIALGIGQGWNSSLVNSLAYMMRDQEQYPTDDYPTVESWVAETKGIVDKPYESDFSDLGVLGVSAQKIKDVTNAVGDAVNVGLEGDESIWYDGYFGPEEYDVSDDGLNNMVQLNALMETLSIPMFSEFGQAWKKMYQEQLENYTPTAEQTKKDRRKRRRN